MPVLSWLSGRTVCGQGRPGYDNHRALEKAADHRRRVYHVHGRSPGAVASGAVPPQGLVGPHGPLGPGGCPRLGRPEHAAV